MTWFPTTEQLLAMPWWEQGLRLCCLIPGALLALWAALVGLKALYGLTTNYFERPPDE